MSGILTPAGYARMWAGWLLLAVGMFYLCMLWGPGAPGAGSVGLGWPATAEIWELRELRVLPAGLVGFALAAAGVTLQALLRNPLADPYVLGISSGSSVGVMVWLLLTGPYAGTVAVMNSPWLRHLLEQGQMLPALLGAVATCLVVFVLARSRWGGGGGGGRGLAGGSADPVTLLLVGVVVSAINGAILMVLNSLAPGGVKANLINYIMGAIANDASWLRVYLAMAVVAAGFVPVVLAGRALNVGSLSDVEAASLGVSVSGLRNVCFLCASVMTAGAIMVSGPIGFVGLICPHICRGIVGADHRKLLVAAPFCGAAFLMAADTFVRATGNVFGGELPVGVITALCGGPFFLILLQRGAGIGEGAL